MNCNFSNVAFYIFGLPIHWYSLAYIFGILIALKLSQFLAEKIHYRPIKNSKNDLEEFINYAVVGIIVGGRLGHVFLYDFDYYAINPYEIIKVWEGGMSFFGGFIGTVCAAYLFCRKHKIDFLHFIDLWAISAPIGLFLGRIANFINGELLGKESKVAWSVVFHDGIHRHPSQIYEAILEGLLLFLVMLLSFHRKYYNFRGRLSGIFCAGYGVARFIGELFRKPDSSFSYQLFFQTGMNLNQYLSIIIFILGAVLICGSAKNKVSP